MKLFCWLLLAYAPLTVAKTFQNSYVSFEVPDDWTCLQEGVAWTCTPQNPLEAKEAVIVLAAKVAGPEDTLPGFLAFLRQPKKITTKVGTPMPSTVMSAEERDLAGHRWISSQHLGSEVQDYYTLYLATVKESLAILVSFSAEKDRYKVYNPIFDKSVKSLRIVASNNLLFPKNAGGNPNDDVAIGINVQPNVPDTVPMPMHKAGKGRTYLYLLLFALIVGGAVYFILNGKSSKPRRK